MKIPHYPEPTVLLGPDVEPGVTGDFKPTWESLQGYETPRWYQDAKFGIWAHWGPQCQPEAGDWYARQMYGEDEPQGRFHRQRYGHPSEVGFKDIIPQWQAEKWDPHHLMSLYARAGAQYFVALANHHDNFDNYDSPYQPWNAVRVGPRRDVIKEWAQAARSFGLRFGVSIHAAHAWTWYETAQGCDLHGPRAGVPYDGKLTKEDGKGRWWEGLDPQDLYAQNHPLSTGIIHDLWAWNPGTGFCPPDRAYCDKFYNRTIQLINTYQPDLLYFDDTVLPLWPVSDVGPRIAAHFYNANRLWHGGNLEAVINGKILDEVQRRCMVWDIERGQSNAIEPFVWQTDTCIGDWHYSRTVLEQHVYKSATTVVHTLADVVSKNGNLLLSIPLRGDGTPDDDELGVIDGIAAWMAVNKEAILATRPWKVFGEGPAIGAAAPLRAQGFNEGKGKPFVAEDIRFTCRDGVIYVISLGVPRTPLAIASLGKEADLLDGQISGIQLLGSTDAVQWKRESSALVIAPSGREPSTPASVFKITMKGR